MTIPYETGNATDHRDLRAKLITFITTNATLTGAGQQWTVLASDSDHAVFKGTGLTGTDEIYWGQYYYEHVGNDIYNWRMYGMTGYNSLTPYVPASHPNAGDYAGMGLRNNTIKYWFIANGRRIIVVTKIDTRYCAMYIGLYLPYVRPSLFPYPYVLGGCNNNNTKYTDNSNNNSLGWMPVGSEANMFMLDASLSWKGIYSHQDTYAVYPWRSIVATSQVPYYAIDGTTYPLYPCILGSSVDSVMYGELDGVFWVPGIGQAAESIITIGSAQYLVIPNIFRSSISEWSAIQIAE